MFMPMITAIKRLRESACIRGQPELHNEFKTTLGY